MSLNSREHISKLSEWSPLKHVSHPLKSLMWGEMSESDFPQRHFPRDIFHLFPYSDTFCWSMIWWEESRLMELVHRDVVWNLHVCIPLLPPAVFALSSTNTSIAEVERFAFKNPDNLWSFNLGCAQNHIKNVLDSFPDYEPQPLWSSE